MHAPWQLETFWYEYTKRAFTSVRLLTTRPVYSPQRDESSCGPACLRMVLPRRPERPVGRGQRDDVGMSGSAIVERLVRGGTYPMKPPHRVSHREISQLLLLVDQNVPAIVALSDPGSGTPSHYAVLVGYNPHYLFFHDPFLRPFYPRLRRGFLEKWHKENRWFVGVAPSEESVRDWIKRSPL